MAYVIIRLARVNTGAGGGAAAPSLFATKSQQQQQRLAVILALIIASGRLCIRDVFAAIIYTRAAAVEYGLLYVRTLYYTNPPVCSVQIVKKEE